MVEKTKIAREKPLSKNLLALAMAGSLALAACSSSEKSASGPEVTTAAALYEMGHDRAQDVAAMAHGDTAFTTAQGQFSEDETATVITRTVPSALPESSNAEGYYELIAYNDISLPASEKPFDTAKSFELKVGESRSGTDHPLYSATFIEDAEGGHAFDATYFATGDAGVSEYNLSTRTKNVPGFSMLEDAAGMQAAASQAERVYQDMLDGKPVTFVEPPAA